MITEPSDRLSPEDLAAAERLSAYLATLIRDASSVRVDVTRLSRVYVVRAHASDRYGSSRVESTAEAATAGEALCDAARQIGLSL